MFVIFSSFFLSLVTQQALSGWRQNGRISNKNWLPFISRHQLPDVWSRTPDQIDCELHYCQTSAHVSWYRLTSEFAWCSTKRQWNRSELSEINCDLLVIILAFANRTRAVNFRLNSRKIKPQFEWSLHCWVFFLNMRNNNYCFAVVRDDSRTGWWTFIIKYYKWKIRSRDEWEITVGEGLGRAAEEGAITSRVVREVGNGTDLCQIWFEWVSLLIDFY